MPAASAWFQPGRIGSIRVPRRSVCRAACFSANLEERTLMARLKLLLAFALGWLSVAAVQFAADAAANAATAGAATQPGSVTWRIAALHESVNVMEKAAAAGKFVRRAMAPFEVVNRAGQRLFYVTPEREVEFYQGRKRAAVMSAAGGVGTLWALSSTQTSAALTGTELTMKENDRLRVALGKDAGHCNYRLQS